MQLGQFFNKNTIHNCIVIYSDFKTNINHFVLHFLRSLTVKKQVFNGFVLITVINRALFSCYKAAPFDDCSDCQSVDRNQLHNVLHTFGEVFTKTLLDTHLGVGGI